MHISNVTEPCGTTSFQKNRPKIRLNLTWQTEHVFGQSTCQKAVQKTKQAARGDDRTGTRSVEAQELRKLIDRLFLVFTDFQQYATQYSKNRKNASFSLIILFWCLESLRPSL